MKNYALLIGLLSFFLLMSCTSDYERKSNDFLLEYSTAITERNEQKAEAIKDSLNIRELTKEQKSSFNTLLEQHKQLSQELLLKRIEEEERLRQEEERLRQEEERQREERIQQILSNFVGTYTINCKKNNFTTHHVLKSRFSEEQTSREWLGTIEWKTILIIRDDLSACVQKANICYYNKNHRLEENEGDGPIMEVGHLEPISENLFYISTARNHTFIEDAIGTRYDSYGGKDDIGVDFETNKAVFDINTNTLYQSHRDYERRNDKYGYDWRGYECAKFSHHK